MGESARDRPGNARAKGEKKKSVVQGGITIETRSRGREINCFRFIFFFFSLFVFFFPFMNGDHQTTFPVNSQAHHFHPEAASFSPFPSPPATKMMPKQHAGFPKLAQRRVLHAEVSPISEWFHRRNMKQTSA